MWLSPWLPHLMLPSHMADTCGRVAAWECCSRCTLKCSHPKQSSCHSCCKLSVAQVHCNALRRNGCGSILPHASHSMAAQTKLLNRNHGGVSTTSNHACASQYDVETSGCQLPINACRKHQAMPSAAERHRGARPTARAYANEHTTKRKATTAVACTTPHLTYPTASAAPDSPTAGVAGEPTSPTIWIQLNPPTHNTAAQRILSAHGGIARGIARAAHPARVAASGAQATVPPARLQYTRTSALDINKHCAGGTRRGQPAANHPVLCIIIIRRSAAARRLGARVSLAKAIPAALLPSTKSTGQRKPLPTRWHHSCPRQKPISTPGSGGAGAASSSHPPTLLPGARRTNTQLAACKKELLAVMPCCVGAPTPPRCPC
jgi:hypothetical protein